MAAGERGSAAEQWVRTFAAKHHILCTEPPPLEAIIKLADTYLQHRFISARKYLEVEISYANEWIEHILQGKHLPKPAPSEVAAHQASRKQLAAKILDYGLATDLILVAKTNSGKECKIAVDITANPEKETTKLITIQGRKENETGAEFNRNQNLPAVRRQLGIDKHLVLVINDRNPPAYDRLLDKLYCFVNQPRATGSINLHEPELELSQPTSSVQLLWQLYSQQISKSNSLEGVKAVAQKALESRAPIEIVPNILKCSPFVQALSSRLDVKQTQTLVDKITQEATIDLEAMRQPEVMLKPVQDVDYVH